MSTCSRDKLALFVSKCFLQKIRSAGVDEAGMHRKEAETFS